MENQLQTQPIIVSQSSKRSAVDYIAGAAAIGAVVYFGGRYLKKLKADSEAQKLDTPQAQAASRIRTAIEGAGTNEGALQEAARFIAMNKIAWKDVAKSYKNLYAANIEDDLRSDLGAEEIKKFYNVFNFTTSSVTTPPPAALLQYDVTKKPLVFITAKETNIRKSPKILGGGYADKIDPSFAVHKSNVIRLVPGGKVVGVATGKSSSDNDGNLFYEFTSVIIVGKATKAIKAWAAASQLTKKEFNYWKEAGDYYTASLKKGDGAIFTDHEFNKASE